MMKPIKIAIVDDNRPNRISLAERITYDGSVVVQFTANDGAQFLQYMREAGSENLPHIALMDIEMPFVNGIEAVNQASVLYPGVKFLMLTVFDDDEKIFEAIKAGAIGYLLKDEKVSVILDGLHQIMLYGASPMSPRIARKALEMLGRATINDLTNATGNNFNLSDREKSILKLMVDGLDYRNIAEELFVSPHTVRNHIANIYNKLHVTSKAQAIKMATKNNLV
ncbi:MAG: response regulator transcription factor [Chitinophagaceae bacterium]|nr:response regulator transcription factor [Chitinophagaceae bacterium]